MGISAPLHATSLNRIGTLPRVDSMVPGLTENGKARSRSSEHPMRALLWTSRIAPRLPAPQAHALDLLKLYRGNASYSAHRLIAAQYESLWRPIPRLATPLPVVAWIFLRGRAPATGTPVNGLTWQIDREGLMLHLRLPENS